MLENYIAVSNETLTLHLQRNAVVCLSAHLLVKDDTNRCNGLLYLNLKVVLIDLKH
jgi:hypothetical protein